MKKNILLVLAVMILVRCGYLDDYSQDMVVVKSVSDLDEVLLGSVYIPSKEEVQDLAWGDIGWWLHILDDDINTVITDQAENRIWNSAMNSAYFGYTTWQMEVGRSYKGDKLAADNALWDDLYRRINVTNIILDEIEDLNPATEEERLDVLFPACKHLCSGLRSGKCRDNPGNSFETDRICRAR